MKKLSGFTLVELLISMGIMMILLTIMTQVFSSILNLRQNSEAISPLAQDSRYLILRLAYDVGRASSISLPAVGNSSSSMTLVISGQNYLYQLNGNSLSLKIGAGTAQNLTGTGTSITSLSFTRNADLGGKPNISLDTTLRATTLQPGIQQQDRRLQSTFIPK
jgi:Tfp pilus assembly protein PilW